jgi:hypothetical protein
MDSLSTRLQRAVAKLASTFSAIGQSLITKGSEIALDVTDGIRDRLRFAVIVWAVDEEGDVALSYRIACTDDRDREWFPTVLGWISRAEEDRLIEHEEDDLERGPLGLRIHDQ